MLLGVFNNDISSARIILNDYISLNTNGLEEKSLFTWMYYLHPTALKPKFELFLFESPVLTKLLNQTS